MEVNEGGGGCMRYFGVKSYLDSFYDRKDQGEHDGYGRENRPRFSSRWWKFLVWFGLFLVLLGLFLLLIGFFLPRQQINVESNFSQIDSEVLIIDRKAVNYNTHLDTSHFLGISFVVAGGVFFTLSLLLPTFCHMWCASNDSNDETDPLKLRMELPISEQSIPIGSVLKPVQPSSREDESRFTTEGIVPLSSSSFSLLQIKRS